MGADRPPGPTDTVPLGLGWSVLLWASFLKGQGSKRQGKLATCSPPITPLLWVCRTPEFPVQTAWKMFAGPIGLFPSLSSRADHAPSMSTFSPQGRCFAGEWEEKGGLWLCTQLTHHTTGVSTHLHVTAPHGRVWGVKRRGQAVHQVLGLRASSPHATTFWHRMSRSSKIKPGLPGCYEGVTVEL